MRISRFAVLMALLPVCASAQTEPDSVRARNACRFAVQIVETGHPAPHSRWAHEFVTRCGEEGGRALASAIRRTRPVTDTVELKAVTRSLRTFRDGAIFTAALEVTGDQGASVPARVIAFRTLVSTMSPGRSLSYAQMTTLATTGVCLGLGAGFHDEVREGTPLPAGSSELLRIAAERVRDDPNEPAEVRQAARCAARYTHSRK